MQTIQLPSRIASSFRALLLILLVIMGEAVSSAANPFVHQLFSNNMVLQRGVAAPIWGWATPGAAVTVTLSGANNATYTAAASSSDGRWQVAVGPFPAGGTYTVTISSSGQTTKTLTNVTMGDVWLCSGQSNMAFTVQGIPVLNNAAEIADSDNYPDVRCFTVPQTASSTPQSTLTGGSWLVANHSNTGNFSATAYFTARELYKGLQRSGTTVPIGILVSAWGGTLIEAWMDPASVAGYADLSNNFYFQNGAPADSTTYCALYNGMINPLLPLKIAGALWYQGEGNSGAPSLYGSELPSMIANLRAQFSPTLPFIAFQLANYGNAQAVPVENGSWAELREAQLATVSADPMSRLVSLIDTSTRTAVTIHPPDKQDAGWRGSLAALNLAYNQDLVNQGPVFYQAQLSGSAALRCSFRNVGDGLMVGAKDILSNPLVPVQQVVNGKLTGFAIADSSAPNIFYDANATIDAATNTVLVSSTSAPHPAVVRYGWGGNPACNLYAKFTNSYGLTDGLPAAPFRSDTVSVLNVVSGTGSGNYALNSVVSISPKSVAGLAFDHWNGDVSLLGSSTTSASNTET